MCYVRPFYDLGLIGDMIAVMIGLLFLTMSRSLRTKQSADIPTGNNGARLGDSSSSDSIGTMDNGSPKKRKIR